MEKSDEYGTLREEMLQRFGVLFDIRKFGVGGILAVIGYSYSNWSTLDPALVLTIEFALLFVLGLAALGEFFAIFKIGTYIAIVLENGDKTKWHRMSRSLDSFSNSLPDSDFADLRPNRVFPFGIRWGADSAGYAVLLLVLAAISFVACWVKAGNLADVVTWHTFVFGVPLLILLYSMVWGMKQSRKANEKLWDQFNKAWRKEFADPYSADDA